MPIQQFASQRVPNLEKFDSAIPEYQPHRFVKVPLAPVFKSQACERERVLNVSPELRLIGKIIRLHQDEFVRNRGDVPVECVRFLRREFSLRVAVCECLREETDAR